MHAVKKKISHGFLWNIGNRKKINIFSSGWTHTQIYRYTLNIYKFTCVYKDKQRRRRTDKHENQCNNEDEHEEKNGQTWKYREKKKTEMNDQYAFLVRLRKMFEIAVKMHWKRKEEIEEKMNEYEKLQHN